MKLTLSALAVVLLVLALASCAKNNKEDILTQQGACDTTATTYAMVIKPILENNCNLSGCHNSNDQAFGINLEDYASVKAMTAQSRFLGSINHQGGFFIMPKSRDKLSDCDISKIEIWVRKGARNN